MSSMVLADAQSEAEKSSFETVRPLSFAVFVRCFPAISESFVLDRVAGLVKRGHSVDIFAIRPRAEAKVHPKISDHQLLDRTFYASRPRSALIGVDELAWAGVQKAHGKPFASYLLDMLVSGKDAASLRLFHPDFPRASKSRYDIILGFFGPNSLRVLQLRKLGLRGKLVTTFGGYDVSSFCETHGENVYDELFRQGDLFLPNCDFFKNKLIALGCDDSKIVVHGDGVDLKRFVLRCQHSRTDGKVRVLVVARLVEKKGIKFAIEAFAGALKQRGNLELTVIGDGPEQRSLEKLIDRLGVREAVNLCGLMDSRELAGFLERSDIVFNSSVVASDGNIDGVPHVLKEAMAAGLPVVASSISGIPELVEDGASGFLVGQADVQTMTDRLLKLADNPDLRFAMGRNGRARVERDYDIDKVMDREIELYRKLIR